MNITNDIILDLLPLYVAGECTPDTRMLVEEYVKNDPILAARIEESKTSGLPVSPLPRLTPDDELETLTRTRKLLRRRTYFLAFAIFCTLTPFSFISTDNQMYWLFRESPISAAIYLVVGAAFWVGYAVSRRRLKGM